jgi:signal transduction histidine kinase
MFAATDASPEVAATAELGLTIGVGLPLLWGAIVFIGGSVTRRALSPVKHIVDTVERIELSRLDERLHVGEVEDELSSIATTVNRMLDRIEEGYGRERQFTGDASHELRGPLAKVIADIDVSLSQERAPEEYRETLMRCRRYAERMQHLVESLLWLARLDARGAAVKLRPFDLTDLLT